ncbi:MAG: hypothetical protein KAH48_00855, partial [Chlorobi bacterium]|nr:hypothetical protein [Chlorobiota bacterium]
RFMVFHRDHGYQGGSGWAEPYFSNSSWAQNVQNLSNGDLLPVVFSINCHTGEFTLPECFSETFLRHSTGGAVGVFAASYYSLSGYNDALSLGFIDAIWSDPGLTGVFGTGGNPNPTLSEHTDIFAMGDVLNQGKIRMAETWSAWPGWQEYQFKLFHYFGDPAMKIWTSNPTEITANHANSVKIGATTLVISSSNCSDALAVVSIDGQMLGKTTLSGGSGTISFEMIQENAVLTISKHNYRPYISNICGLPTTPESITQPSLHCSGTSQTYSTNDIDFADSYEWAITGENWSVDGSSATFVSVTAGSESATLTVNAANTCGSGDTYTLELTPSPLPGDAGTISEPTIHCAGAIETYSVEAIENAEEYTWTITGTGWSGTSITNSIDITSGSGSGTISVSGDNICGSGSSTFTIVTPLLIPNEPATIYTPALHCSETSATYSIDEVEYADSYVWLVDGLNWTGSSTTTEIVLTAGNSPCELSVRAINICGSSHNTRIDIDPLLIPDQPGTINEPALHCTATIETYSISPVLRADEYVWTISNPAWSGTSTSTDIDITSASGSSTVTVAAVNSCGSSLVSSIVAEAIDLPTASASLSVPNGHCSGVAETYTGGEVEGATAYVWTVQGNGWTGSSTTNVCAITAGSGDAIIRMAAVNACGTGPSISRTIPSIQMPNEPSPIVGPNAHCKNGTGFYSVDNQSDA